MEVESSGTLRYHQRLAGFAHWGKEQTIIFTFKQIKYETFDDYYATIPKSKLELAYLEELRNANGATQEDIEKERMKINAEWKKEKKGFLKG